MVGLARVLALQVVHHFAGNAFVAAIWLGVKASEAVLAAGVAVLVGVVGERVFGARLRAFTLRSDLIKEVALKAQLAATYS